MRSLTIISHTEHYKNSDGTLVGLGSTVTEINHLLEIFDSIIHVAMFHNTIAPPSALPYCSDRISFVPLQAVGGTKLLDKLKVLWATPKTLGIINRSLSRSDYFQFRAPTGIGVFTIPYLIVFSSKKGWFKYAGDWTLKEAPLAYRIQRWFLKRQERTVTINGKWSSQPAQCLTFENPCLTEKDVSIGQVLKVQKTLQSDGIQICFVGRLEEAKGLGVFIDAISELDDTEKLQIQKVHIVGDGVDKSLYRERGLKSGVKFIFHGFLSRSEVHNIYKLSHAIVLPSTSEGFPKVIAEAMNYGCLPIVSNISSISHYINNSNGFLLITISVEEITNTLQKFLQLSESDYSSMITLEKTELHKFTYAYYNKRIETEIL